MPSTTKPSNLIFTLLLTLVTRQCQMRPCLRGEVGHAPKRITEIVDIEGETRNIPEGGDGNFGQDPEVGTASVSCMGHPTNSG